MKTHHAFTGLRLNVVLLFAAIFLPFQLRSGSTPPVVGNWHGVLDGGELGKLRVVVHIVQAKNGTLTGTVDSPDQGATGIPISSVTYKNSAVHFVCRTIGGFYDGNMKDGNSQIDGTWQQGTRQLPLLLVRTK